MKTTHLFLLLTLACTATALAVDPPPDGGYSGANTAEGEDALFSLTTGLSNTAMGYHALHDNATGDQNTAYGAVALANNTTGFNNTAVGFQAMQANTTGLFNTAIGFVALTLNTTGSSNSAFGHGALAGNTVGIANTAVGLDALSDNHTGSDNTATGYQAMSDNHTGSGNAAYGASAMGFTVSGDHNTAIGEIALFNNGAGAENTGIGYSALLNNTGSQNIALGSHAGESLTSGSNNVDVANTGVAGESGVIRIGTSGVQTATYIAGITGVPVGGAHSIGVTADGQLGVRPSSERFKEAIEPMDKQSSALLALRPVSFRYKHALDPSGARQFGLVAEEVAKVDPDLVDLDAKGNPFTVRYDEVNAMLLNEFLKEHRTVQELKSTVAKQEAIIAHQQKGMEAVTARLEEQDSKIQKMSDQLELTKPAPQMAVNNQ